MKSNLMPTPCEAYQFEKYSDCGIMLEALKIADYCDNMTAQEADRLWAYMKKIHVVFVAGYVAGVREVRRRKKERVQ